MTAYATGGLTPEDDDEEPEGWPPGWTYPPTVTDPGEPDGLWPPGWPLIWFGDSLEKVLASPTSEILFVDTDAPATSPDTAVITYTVDVQKPGGANYTDLTMRDHLMGVWITDPDGDVISAVDTHKIAVDAIAGVTQMTGSLTATVTTDMASVSLTCRIVSLRDTDETEVITVDTVTLELSVSSACTGDSLGSQVGVVGDVDNLWGDPVVTTATVVEE